MKIKYSPGGGGKKQSPRTWEVWLADVPAGAPGKVKRGPVAVGKRGPAGWTVYPIIPAGERDGRDAVIGDLHKAGQERPSAVHVVQPCTVRAEGFVQKMGELSEADLSKVLSGLRRDGS